MLKLEPGGWMVWLDAPKTGSKYLVQVRRLAIRSGVPLEAFLDVDRRVIVRRLPDPA